MSAFDQLTERFRRDVVIDASGCWLWIGTQTANGYGLYGSNGRYSPLAHRAAYQQIVGPIPEGLDLDHLCRTRLCVNPDCMEPVTRSENLLRIPRPERTHCLHGHEMTEENTYVNGKRRHCRACQIERNQRWYRNNREKAIRKAAQQKQNRRQAS